MTQALTQSTESGTRGVLPLAQAALTQPVAEELRDLGELLRASVHVCGAASVVELVGERASETLAATIAAKAAAADAEDASSNWHVRIRPLAPTRVLESRFADPRYSITVGPKDDVREAANRFVELVGDSSSLASLGGSLSRLRALVFFAFGDAIGQAASVDPDRGDPDLLWSWQKREAPWVVDRRTARVVRGGEGSLDDRGASLVADLADRAQLALGSPVEVDWVLRGDGSYAVVGVRPLRVVPAFTSSPFRILTLVASDEGTVAPIAVDALDRALSRDDLPSDEPRVRRIYARPYRRQDGPERVRRSSSGAIAGVGGLGLRAAQIAKDVAAPLNAVRTFERGLDRRLRLLDRVDLGELTDDELVTALWDRHKLAVEAFVLLDRHRLATIAVLGALEMAGSPLPRETFPAIARPRMTRSRRRAVQRLQELAKKIVNEHGELVHYDALARPLRGKWQKAREESRDLRPLGIDVLPDAFGASNEDMYGGLATALQFDEAKSRRERKLEVERVLAAARGRSLGRSRETLASSLLLLQSRVSKSKGVAIEGLAAALLRVRRAALQVGERFVDRDLLDEPQDALHLYLPEIEEAMAEEPGAYAARVRLRKENDARWASFRAPRRIYARRPHGQ